MLGVFFDLEDGGTVFLRNVVDFQRTTPRYIPLHSTFLNTYPAIWRYVSLSC
jgi:hypothetical protein